jgi:hypothetical protein
MDTQKDAYMQEHLKKTKAIAPPTPSTGKVDMDAFRLGLAMVMDGLRVMARAGAKVTVPHPMKDGGILLSMVFVHDHVITVMDKKMFAIDGVSVMAKQETVVKSLHNTAGLEPHIPK